MWWRRCWWQWKKCAGSIWCEAGRCAYGCNSFSPRHYRHINHLHHRCPLLLYCLLLYCHYHCDYSTTATLYARRARSLYSGKRLKPSRPERANTPAWRRVYKIIIKTPLGRPKAYNNNNNITARPVMTNGFSSDCTASNTYCHCYCYLRFCCGSGKKMSKPKYNTLFVWVYQRKFKGATTQNII